MGGCFKDWRKNLGMVVFALMALAGIWTCGHGTKMTLDVANNREKIVPSLAAKPAGVHSGEQWSFVDSQGICASDARSTFPIVDQPELTHGVFLPLANPSLFDGDGCLLTALTFPISDLDSETKWSMNLLPDYFEFDFANSFQSEHRFTLLNDLAR